MTTQGRGWDDELVVHSETTTGQPVDIFVGRTRDPRHPGREVGAIGIGNGPTALLRLDGDVGNGTEVSEHIRLTLAKLLKRNKQGGV